MLMLRSSARGVMEACPSSALTIHTPLEQQATVSHFLQCLVQPTDLFAVFVNQDHDGTVLYLSILSHLLNETISYTATQ